jgi:hypothetical protein
MKDSCDVSGKAFGGGGHRSGARSIETRRGRLWPHLTTLNDQTVVTFPKKPLLLISLPYVTRGAPVKQNRDTTSCRKASCRLQAVGNLSNGPSLRSTRKRANRGPIVTETNALGLAQASLKGRLDSILLGIGLEYSGSFTPHSASSELRSSTVVRRAPRTAISLWKTSGLSQGTNPIIFGSHSTRPGMYVIKSSTAIWIPINGRHALLT